MHTMRLLFTILLSVFSVYAEQKVRTPLILTASDVDPKSVRVFAEEPNVNLVLGFKGKTPEEMQKLVMGNLGNKVHVRGVDGRIVESGSAAASLSDDKRNPIGLVLIFKKKQDARAAAKILRVEKSE